MLNRGTQYTRHSLPWLPGVLSAILATTCVLNTARAQTLPGWALVWADDFSQTNGSAPDSAKWAYNLGGGGWGNNEWQYYTSRTNNARIEDGLLVIEAHQEGHQGSNYTSARLLTKNLAAWTHGRIEARIKVPRGQGIWPAFWMLGENNDEVGWPRCGEIDIMECIGREPRTVYGTIHGPGYSGAAGVGGSHTNRASDLADNFHVFAVEWEPQVIRWYFDNEPYFAVTPESTGDSPWVFEHPHFILLNVAVGGRWPGYPDETTVFPQQLQVDYVRVYARRNTMSPNPDDEPHDAEGSHGT